MNRFKQIIGKIATMVSAIAFVLVLLIIALGLCVAVEALVKVLFNL